VAKRLSGENTSARLIGSCVKLFKTVPRRLSVCSMPGVVLCADNRVMLLQQERPAMPKASALSDRGERIYFAVHPNFPEQTPMVGIPWAAIMAYFERNLSSTGLCTELFATRRSSGTWHFNSRHHAITPGCSATGSNSVTSGLSFIRSQMRIQAKRPALNFGQATARARRFTADVEGAFPHCDAEDCCQRSPR